MPATFAVKLLHQVSTSASCTIAKALAHLNAAVCSAVRTAAFGVRAAYTVRYRPALSGTWLAFNNAGFGANTATLCLAVGTWYALWIPAFAIASAHVNIATPGMATWLKFAGVSARVNSHANIRVISQQPSHAVVS